MVKAAGSFDASLVQHYLRSANGVENHNGKGGEFLDGQLARLIAANVDGHVRTSLQEAVRLFAGQKNIFSPPSELPPVPVPPDDACPSLNPA